MSGQLNNIECYNTNERQNIERLQHSVDSIIKNLLELKNTYNSKKQFFKSFNEISDKILKATKVFNEKIYKNDENENYNYENNNDENSNKSKIIGLIEQNRKNHFGYEDSLESLIEAYKVNFH